MPDAGASVHLSPAASADGPPGRRSPRPITHPDEIASVLIRLCEARTLLSARVKQEDGSFLTSVIRVDTRARRLLLDELNPRTGHDALLRQRSLRAFARLGGVNVAFGATLAGVTFESGVALYEVAFPETLHYEQQRGAYRVAIGSLRGVALRLRDEGGLALEGEVRDLSVSGAGARVQVPPGIEVPGGHRFRDCSLRLAGAQSIECGFEARYVVPLPGSRFSHVGGRFLDLSRRDQHALAQFVAHLEREHLKLRPAAQRSP
jgi:c-di-GMP-binding flagellar brake protein YcgR